MTQCRRNFCRMSLIATCAAIFTFVVLAVVPSNFAFAASKIKVLVNNEPITSYDIARRKSLLRLQRAKSGTAKATKELVDEAMKMQEAKRLNAVASQKEVNSAYSRFAGSNRMTVRQLNSVLNRAGVTPSGFKNFIRSQMSWQRVLGARYRAESGTPSRKNFTEQLRANGGKKPEAREYFLQQIIFVVPKAKRRRLMAKRRREAKAFRNRFESCNSTREFAKGLRDVTVRKLGRVLDPQLPPEWKKYIQATSAGKATRTRDTERGVEFIGVCSITTVNDDRVAQLKFQTNSDSKAIPALEKKYLEELRARAVIIRR